MNHDSIIRLVRQATDPTAEDPCKDGVITLTVFEMSRLIGLVEAAYVKRTKYDGIHTCSHRCQRPFCVALREAVAAEREQCALICDAEASCEGIAERCAEAIRARGSV